MEEIFKKQVLEYLAALSAPTPDEKELEEVLLNDAKTQLNQNHIDLMLTIWKTEIRTKPNPQAQ